MKSSKAFSLIQKKILVYINIQTQASKLNQ